MFRPMRIRLTGSIAAAGTSTAAELGLLRQAVRIAEQQLGQVIQEDEQDPYNGRLRKAQWVAKRAKANWQEAWDANRRMPGIIHPHELEKLYLIAQFTQFRLDETRAASVQSELDHLQSQLKELGEEVHRLRDRVDVLSMRN